ncbi:MAG: MBL fold metallo-hydrolase [Planctomycetota bacterium]
MHTASPALRFDVVPVTPFFQNCTLLCCTASGKAAVIDPGGDVDLVMHAIERARLAVERILLTHGHVDHVGGTGELVRRLGVPVEGPHREDRFLLEDLPGKAAMFGLEEPLSFLPDRWLAGGDEVRVGELVLEVLHCPGHTPGHVVFFHRPSRFAQVGDVLFRGSIGRTDFPRGDHRALLRSIRDTLLPLGDDVTFVPGHGPLSTLGAERRSNPFLVETGGVRFP